MNIEDEATSGHHRCNRSPATLQRNHQGGLMLLILITHELSFRKEKDIKMTIEPGTKPLHSIVKLTVEQ